MAYLYTLAACVVRNFHANLDGYALVAYYPIV